jgi:AbrB family looped-hinge helix DNA binding protein
MATATMTSKGQVTIPASVRKEMGVNTGSRIEFVPLGNGRYEMVAANLPVTNLKGMLQATRHVSIEEMNDAIAQMGTKANDRT